MKSCRLPTRRECFDLLKEYHVPSHIVAHSLAVAKLAVFLAQRLKERGIAVDIDLVDRACLLHDVVRACDFKESNCNDLTQAVTDKDKAEWRQIRTRYKGTCHEDVTYDLLRERYPAVALAIKKHRYAAILDEDEKEKPSTWEEKLVYYADKRVMHDRIVTLNERLEDAHKRNIHLHETEAQSKITTAKVDPVIFKLEKEIFDQVDLDADEVTDEFINSRSSRTLENL